MAGNKHIKRYKALADLQQALSEGKITSPGIIALDDESVHYDNNLKSIYPQYVINKGDFDWESFKIYNVKPEEDTPVETIFSLDKEFEYIYLDGGTISLNITSNKPWSCRYNSNYCTVSSSSSDGNKNITITTFYTESSRDINIDFYIENKKVATFPIYQYAYEDMPLTLEALTDGTIYYVGANNYNNNYNDTIQYSINGQSLQTSTIRQGVYINAKNGDRIMIFGNSKNPKGESSYTQFGGTATFNVYGNIKSLFNWDDNYMYSYCCYQLFRDSNVYNAGNLILPAIILSNHCYENMFFGCNYLTIVPTLPATTLAEYCYSGIFCYCYQLNGIPSNYLPATTLANHCYSDMFENCINLTSVPLLPATTLANNCYAYMFSGCSRLGSTPVLNATTLANGCYAGMFKNCTSLTTAPSLPATTLVYNCYYSMFQGCTSLTTAPSLPATTLAEYCYYLMFSGCSSLTIAPAILPATTLYQMCYCHMFADCVNLVKAPELPALIVSSYACYNHMFYGCSKLNYIKCLATDISGQYCITGWVEGVASSGTFIKHPNMSSWTTGNNGIPSNWTIENDYSLMPLTFEILEDGEISWKTSNSDNRKTIQYSKNGGEWTSIISSINGTTISVTNGDIIKFKGNNTTYASDSYYNYFNSTCNFNIKGNIMSLLYDNFIEQTDLLYNYCFHYLFNQSKVISAGNLILPSITLTQYCYAQMFYHCTSLITAPNLPARVLANYCYNGMFYDCTNLINIPSDLPAYYIQAHAYDGMFQDCTSLVHAPRIYASYIKECGCANMFWNCTSLVDTPRLYSYTLANYCYHNMFYHCISLTSTAIVDATTLADGCYNGMYSSCYNLISTMESLPLALKDFCYTNMFSHCTSLIKAPNLPATILKTGCYEGMFEGCTSLTIAPELPATTLEIQCYQDMFNNCKSLITAPELPAITLVQGCYMGMFQGCSKLNYINCSATNISANQCIYCWTQNVSSTGTFIKNPSMTSWSTGQSGIPDNWEIIDNDYLTIEILFGYQLSFIGTRKDATQGTKYISYKKNNDDWVTIPFEYYWSNLGIYGKTISVEANDIIKLKANNIQYNQTDGSDLLRYSITGNNTTFNISGNIMSLCYGDNYINKKLTQSSQFFGLFSGSGIINANKLILPFNTTHNCYAELFKDCTLLENTPKLLSNSAVNKCYKDMFKNCRSLTSTPELPATILDSYCYQGMFEGCSRLTTVSKLPATTLVGYCYSSMFRNCTSLTTAPELPATTLANWCYEYMFQGCNNLNYIKCLATTNVTTGNTFDWVNGVASSGTFIKDPSMNDWTTGDSGIPSGWTVQDAA